MSDIIVTPLLERDGIKIGGYRKDLENEQWLAATAQPFYKFSYGAINPANLGDPLGLVDAIRIEDQSQLNSCAGNSVTSIAESCLFLEGGIRDIQLSRMWAYIKGQAKSGIRGDNGATLEGCLKACSEGIPEERFAPYTNSYYTQFSEAARADTVNRKIKSWAAVAELMSVYEGLATGAGGIYLGIACTDVIFNCKGIIEDWNEYSTGCHAMCVLDWSKRRVQGGLYAGWPYLKLFNSWKKSWGDNGTADVHPAAMLKMIRGRLSSVYFVSEMEFIKPRFDWKDANKRWAA
jgi:hypothetical protein